MQFEILIPTVEGRERYLEWCLRSCLVQIHGSFGILVSNNGGARSVRDLVKSIDDPRLRYIETPCVLPMCFHWEFMVSHALGDYLSILGDDDALMPNALIKAERILNEYPGALAVTHEPAHYYWPDYPIKSLRNKYSCRGRGGSVTLRNSKTTYDDVAEFRAWYGQLPFLYHGFIARSVLKKIENELGGLFLRPAPDVFVDLALGIYVGSYVHIKDCLTIGGQGAKSTGASCVTGDDPGRAFVESHPENIRPKYSISTITLQVFEYLEFLEAGASYPNNRSIDWWLLFRAVLHEALLAPSNRQCKGVLSDLTRVLEEKSQNPARNLLLVSLWIMRMPGVVAALRHWQLGRRERLNQGLPDAAIDFSATNVFHLGECLAAVSSVTNSPGPEST